MHAKAGVSAANPNVAFVMRGLLGFAALAPTYAKLAQRVHEIRKHQRNTW